MRTRRYLLLALASLLLPRGVPAQVLTGEVVVVVRDEQGLPLAGAVARLSSPSLIGGALTQQSNDQGRLRFPALQPGTYTLDVQMARFLPSQTTGLRIDPDKNIQLPIVLRLEGTSVDVHVIGQARDGRSPGFSTRFDLDAIARTPTQRNGLFAFVATAPGVSQTSNRTSFVSAAGSGIDQNVSLVDGINVTATSNGIMRIEPSLDVVESVHVQLLGVSAEYGNVQGAVFNIVTRQGSNRLSWEGSYYGQFAWLTSRSIIRPINFVGPDSSGYERRRYIDASTTLGGPVARDRLWFFSGYQFLRDEDSQPATDPRIPRNFKQDKAFGKLTWRLAPGWLLVQSIFGESWDNRELPTATKLPDATQRLRVSAPAVNFGNLTHTTAASRVWEANASMFAFSQNTDRSFGDATVAGRLNRVTNVQSGAPTQLGKVSQLRWTAKASVSQFQPRVLGGDHDWKIGAQFDRGQHRSLTMIPTGVRYEDRAPAPPQAFFSDPSNAGGLFTTSAVFATDSMNIRDRLTISAGLRFDQERATSPDVRELNGNRMPTGRTIRGDGLLYVWNVFSPRAGFAWKLSADERTLVRGSYGRFNQGILTGELSPDHPGMQPSYQRDCDASGSNCTANEVKTDPRANIQISARMRAPRTDVYSLGLEHELPGGMLLGASYIHKDGSDFIGWTDVAGQYSTVTWVENGVSLPISVLTSPARNRLYELGNRPEYSLTYNGVVAMFERRHARGWDVNGSYTWSRAAGLQPSSGTTASGAQVATVGAPPVSFTPPVTFGRDPNTLINAYGRLPNDRPHLVRLTGSITLPKLDVLVAAMFQHSSGKPWAYTADINLAVVNGGQPTGQQTQRVFLEPRGSRRLSSQTMLDLRVARVVTLSGLGLEFRADALNLLNDTAEEAIASDSYKLEPKGVVWVDPRRVMVSVKVNLGR